ncbi:Minichromosome maintenance domain-containing protein 2 [Linnemannia zychae]|nr:Minichromosome maintenance domain-containing protein 2 [Linnemannia zychae]
MTDIRRAISESSTAKAERGTSISRYVIRMNMDPIELLQTCSSLGNQLLCAIESIEPDVHLVCCQILQQFMSLDENPLLAEQVRLCLRLKYLPQSFRENYLCFTPSAPLHRVIKRTEDEGFMETSTNATLLNVDLTCSHCDLEMPESVIDRIYMKQQKITLECLHVQRAQGCFVNQVELLLLDDLANSASLGDRIEVIGRLRRSFPGKDQDKYQHGMEMDVNNVLQLPRYCGQESIPGAIETIVTSDLSPWNTSQAIVDLLGEHAHFHAIDKEFRDETNTKETNVTPSNSKSPPAEKDEPLIRRSIHILIVMNGRDTVVPTLLAGMAALKSHIFWDHGEAIARKKLYSLFLPKNRRSSGGGMEIRASHVSMAKDGVLLFELDQLDKKAQAHIAPMIGQHELETASDVSWAIASHTLQRHMQDERYDEPSTQLSREDLSQYLYIASTVQVRLSTECEYLLRAYFQVMRKKGFGPEINALSSLSTMSTLLNVATCHAKICLRAVANRYDALVSIMMMEETIAARFGTSCLGFVPLLDGKENIARLYAHLEPVEDDALSVSEQDGRPQVPVFEPSFDGNMDMGGTATLAADANVPMSLQDTRDQVMKTMYAHLTRVISEYADSVDINF